MQNPVLYKVFNILSHRSLVTPAAERLMKNLVMLCSDKLMHPKDDMLMYMDKLMLSAINHRIGYASYVNKHADNSNPTTHPSAKAGIQPYSTRAASPWCTT